MKILNLLLITLPIYAGGSYYKVVNVAHNDTLNVRSSPTTKAKIVTKLMPYDSGLVIKKCKRVNRSTWCKVAFIEEDYFMYERDFTNYAWVNKRYLKRARNIIYSDGINYNKYHNIFKVNNVKSNDVLYVREHPYSSAKKIGHLKHNDIGIIARKCQWVGRSKWCYVAYSYTMGLAMGEGSAKVPYALLGWVNMRYLRKDYSNKKGRLPKNMMFAGEVY